jgi:hypothetical protein
MLRPALAAFFFVAGCVSTPTPTPTAYAPPPPAQLPFMGPTHPPSTAEQWALMDTQAHTAAETGGGRPVARFHVTSLDTLAAADPRSPCVMHTGERTKIFCAEKIVPVAGALCYTLGVAWSFPAKAAVDVVFLPATGRAPPNAIFASKHFELEPSVGTGSFCTDAPGRISVRVQAITAQRIIINDEILEYSVALATTQEDSQQAAVRQRAEAAAAEETLARQEANIFAAEMREHGESFARMCQRCRDLSRGCRDDAGRCRAAFEACAQSAGTDRRGRILCSPGVR